MAWQEVFPLNVSHIDAEEERELRLASQARAGAEWALAALVARYQPPVTRYLTRLTGNPDTSRALAERIFVRMENRLRGPHGGQRLRLWLLRACTESGLDALRHPHHSHATPRLDSPHTAGLLPERAGEAAVGKLRSGLGALANLTGSTSRQVRQLIWSNGTDAPQHEPRSAPARSHKAPRANGTEHPFQRRTPPPIVIEEDPAQQDPREALRYRMVRAVLAEIPYGDAQCLALHLIAGLNQAEVAQALGITHSATRRRIVQGLQLFAQRYEAAIASLGISLESLAPNAPRMTQPPRIARTTPPTPAAAAPLSETPPDSLEMMPIEEQPTGAWEMPAFAPPPRTTGAPTTFVPPSPEPVTVVAATAPEMSESNEADTLILEEHAAATPHPDAEKPMIIVETTAIVDAVPVIALPLVDTAVISAPDVTAADVLLALRLAAVEIPACPPDPVRLETATHELSLPTLTTRFVPILTPAPAVPYAPRVVPVLTSADPAESRRDTSNEVLAVDAAPLVPAAPTPAERAVRIVPVLTPTTSTGSAPLSGVPVGEEANTSVYADADAFEAPHKPIAMTMEAPNDAAIEAQAQ